MQRNFLRLPALAADGGAEHREGGPPEAPLLVQAILNPLSKPAQRLAPLLRFLRAALGAETHLLLNPQARLWETNSPGADPHGRPPAASCVCQCK